MKLSARSYIILGLVSIVSTTLLAASFFGLVPDSLATTRAGRLALAESLAASSATILSGQEPSRLEEVLRFVKRRNPAIQSIGLRTREGRLVIAAGEHAREWIPMESGKATDAQVEVVLFNGDQPWGRLEMRFVPTAPPGLAGILQMPFLKLWVFCAVVCFLAFFVYLTRVLRHLDPAQAVPSRVRTALDSLTEGLLVVDQKENIVLANEALTNLLGRSNEQMMGKPVSSIAWLDAVGATLTGVMPWSAALESGTVQRDVHLKLLDSDGKQRSFVTNCSPVVASSGKPSGVLISLEDITLLEESRVKLRLAKDDAEAANRAKSAFLANMSHEIRTPMNAILGFTELLQRGFAKNERDSARYLDTIQNSGKHLLGLINDILDLSKVEAGQLSVEKIPCAPHAVVQSALLDVGLKAQEKGITLSLRLLTPVPEQVESDPARIRQVVLNLLSNAVKFTERGGVQVELACRDGIYTVQVNDTGIGIDASKLDAMFEPFTQADASISRRFGGTGLGLAISRHLAQALGGDVTASSQIGVGTSITFSFSAPVAEGVRLLDALSAAEVGNGAASQNRARWKMKAARVLVVDDGAENRELLRLVLAENGLNVDEAENGQIALDRIAATSYDLVLMDVQMPVMDGYAATSAIRRRGLQLPVVALTANAMKGYEADLLSAGFTAYLTKPVDLDALMKQLGELLGGSRPIESEPELAPAATVLSEADTVQVATQRIRSRFAGNPRLAPVVRKFAARLHEQLEIARRASAAGDLVEIARLAHWLSGAAGTVGYDAFTQPAKQMEAAAQAGHHEQVNAVLQGLIKMASEVEVPA